jgi:hypothetical protein
VLHNIKLEESMMLLEDPSPKASRALFVKELMLTGAGKRGGNKCLMWGEAEDCD